MQGKGIVRVFFWVTLVLSIIQYFFYFPTRKIERNADNYAQTAALNYPEEKQDSVERALRISYLDSVSNEVVFSIPLIKDFTYQELKARQLALGLDLKGGMSVVLQVDLKDFLLAMSNYSDDETFKQALDDAQKALANSQSDYVTLFADAYRKLSDGGKSLARIFSRNQSLREEINFETSDAEVVTILRREADETVELTFKRLKDRIDELGVTQPNVSLDKARDLILVELPGIDNPERARSFLQATAQLEFWDVYRVNDPGILEAFSKANDLLKKLETGDTTEVEKTPNYRIDTVKTAQRDSLGNLTGDTLVTYDTTDLGDNPFPDAAAGGPLFDVFTPNGTGGQLSFGLSVMGTAEGNQIKQVNEYLEKPEIKRLFPNDVSFHWSSDPVTDLDGNTTNDYTLHAIKTKGRKSAPLEGDRITSASANPDPQTGEVQVSLNMDGQGAKIWRDMTTVAARDQNREIAILLDGEVVSAPRVNEPITGGRSSISGNFSLQEGQDLANILEIGKLPAKPRIIQEVQIGPSLGKENIDRSVNALLIGFILVLLFMIFYYGGGGIVSIIALFFNLFFIFAALAGFGTVLTLPGIAGVVLTIGMAVDANVIIFERIREELRDGKSLLMAISDGFQNSYSAILDANVTTLLTAIVLERFGLGPIKGFAVVLIIGVIFSVFTAVFFGRMLIEWWTKKGRDLSFYTGFTKNALANVNIDWLGKRKIAYAISGTIIVLGLASFLIRGFELGVDFKGGYSYNVQFEESITVSADEVRNSLEGVFGAKPVVKAVSSANTYNITTSYLINDNSEEASDDVLKTLHEGVNGLLGGNVDFNNFKNPDGTGTHITSSSKVGPTIADDIQKSAFYAAIFALLLIFLYIFIRFSKWQYSLGAVAALFHDSLVVLAVFSIGHGILPFSLEIDQAFIAAILTVIGYSINDTVVVFDRIREFFGIYANKSKTEVINMAVNSTISRTVITSLTTLFVVLILFVFGGTSIKGFAFAILIGIIVGTYSSVFVATPLMSDLTGEIKPKETKKKSLSDSVKAR